MKILFVGGGRTFEVFRGLMRDTTDENGEKNIVRWAGNDDVFRGYTGPIHVVYDDHYLASGSLNAREEANIRLVAIINAQEARGGHSSRNDPYQIDRRRGLGSASGDAGVGREAHLSGDLLHGGVTASRDDYPIGTLQLRSNKNSPQT